MGEEDYVPLEEAVVNKKFFKLDYNQENMLVLRNRNDIDKLNEIVQEEKWEFIHQNLFWANNQWDKAETEYININNKFNAQFDKRIEFRRIGLDIDVDDRQKLISDWQKSKR